MGDLPKKRMAKAQRRTRKEVGLKKELPVRWGLKDTLKRKRGLNGALKKEVWLENTLPKW